MSLHSCEFMELGLYRSKIIKIILLSIEATLAAVLPELMFKEP